MRLLIVFLLLVRPFICFLVDSRPRDKLKFSNFVGWIKSQEVCWLKALQSPGLPPSLRHLQECALRTLYERGQAASSDSFINGSEAIQFLSDQAIIYIRPLLHHIMLIGAREEWRNSQQGLGSSSLGVPRGASDASAESRGTLLDHGHLQNPLEPIEASYTKSDTGIFISYSSGPSLSLATITSDGNHKVDPHAIKTMTWDKLVSDKGLLENLFPTTGALVIGVDHENQVARTVFVNEPRFSIFWLAPVCASNFAWWPLQVVSAADNKDSRQNLPLDGASIFAIVPASGQKALAETLISATLVENASDLRELISDLTLAIRNKQGPFFPFTLAALNEFQCEPKQPLNASLHSQADVINLCAEESQEFSLSMPTPSIPDAAIESSNAELQALLEAPTPSLQAAAIDLCAEEPQDLALSMPTPTSQATEIELSIAELQALLGAPMPSVPTAVIDLCAEESQDLALSMLTPSIPVTATELGDADLQALLGAPMPSVPTAVIDLCAEESQDLALSMLTPSIPVTATELSDADLQALVETPKFPLDLSIQNALKSPRYSEATWECLWFARRAHKISKRAINIPKERDGHRFSQVYVVGMSGYDKSGGSNVRFGFDIRPHGLVVSDSLRTDLKEWRNPEKTTPLEFIEITLSENQVLVSSSSEAPHVAISYTMDGVFSLLSKLEGGETVTNMERERAIIVGPLKLLEVLCNFHSRLAYPGESEDAWKTFVSTLYTLMPNIPRRQHVLIVARVSAV